MEVVCRDQEVAAKRFLVYGSDAGGVVVTRTGRPFFSDNAQETALLDKTRRAVEVTGLWDELCTDWLVLD